MRLYFGPPASAQLLLLSAQPSSAIKGPTTRQRSAVELDMSTETLLCLEDHAQASMQSPNAAQVISSIRHNKFQTSLPRTTKKLTYVTRGLTTVLPKDCYFWIATMSLRLKPAHVRSSRVGRLQRTSCSPSELHQAIQQLQLSRLQPACRPQIGEVLRIYL